MECMRLSAGGMHFVRCIIIGRLSALRSVGGSTVAITFMNNTSAMLSILGERERPYILVVVEKPHTLSCVL